MRPSTETAEMELERNTAQRVINLWTTLRACKLGVMTETGRLGGPDFVHPQMKKMMFDEAMAIAAMCDIGPEVQQ